MQPASDGLPAPVLPAPVVDGGRPAVGAVAIVIPAHDEQERIGDCVRSVGRAADHLRVVHPEIRTELVVVLDRCTDGTSAAIPDPTTRRVSIDAACVGAARRAGVDAARSLLHEGDPRTVLLVNTDADCTVPDTWLVELVALAREHDVVLGEVEPDPAEMTPATLAAWWERHPRGRGSLHGANLAVRLDAYLRAGGFPEISRQEDLLLVRALRATGASVVGGTRVTTSGRRQGRVELGFAAYLRHLDLELALDVHPLRDAATVPAGVGAPAAAPAQEVGR